MKGIQPKPLRRVGIKRKGGKLRIRGLKRATGHSRRQKGGKIPSISKLIKEADRLFSLKVRGADVIGAGNACFTCGKWYPAKKLQCGHFLSRYYKAARWDFDNARPQCMMCNLWKRGDPIVFRQNLIKEIGIERVEAVEKRRHQSIKLTREYLEELITSLKV